MEYLRVLLACAAEPWALQEQKLAELSQLLVFKAKGGMFSKEEMRGRISQQTERQVARADGNVGILPVYGMLAQRMNMMAEISGGTSTELIGAQLREMVTDDNIKAIILDYDSPGGAVYGIEELAEEIYNSRGVKPIIAQVNSLAASAAYWLASQHDEIVVTPSGQAGSIGVYRIHEDVSKMLADSGITTTIVKAGENKIEDNPLEPLSEEARMAMKARIDQTYAKFVAGVARGRNVSKSAVLDRMGRGRVYGAEDLLDRGMADRIATLPETLERFGGGVVNPVASAARERNVARADAAGLLISKLKAGDLLSPRELENGLKGLVAAAGETLTNAEAERAVRRCFKGSALGEPGKPAASTVPVAAISELRGASDIINNLLSQR